MAFSHNKIVKSSSSILPINFKDTKFYDNERGVGTEAVNLTMEEDTRIAGDDAHD